MKTRITLLVWLLGATFASAQSFPGLKSILSQAEWERAGLNKLTPDQIGVIDAALIRHQSGATAQLQAEINKVRAQAAPTSPANPGFMQRFGLPLFNDNDWKAMPTLQAKVVKWEGGNRFKLDNGQVWEGSEPIPYELPGKDIAIEARPHGQFALIVEGQNTTVRVMRLR